MKTFLKLALLGIAAIGISHSASAQNLVTLNLTPVTTSTNASTGIIDATFNLNISGLRYLTDDQVGSQLAGFDVYLNTGSLTVGTVNFGASNGTDYLNVDANGTVTAPNITTGQLELWEMSGGTTPDFASQPAAFTLGQVEFQGTLAQFNDLAFDAADTSLTNANGDTIPASDVTETVQAVPEPSTYASIVVGALGLLCWGAKTRRRPSVA